MQIIYTKHAEFQIEDRHIEKIWIEEAIKTPDELRRKDDKYYATRKLNGKTIKVVYLKEGYIKITTSFSLK